MFVRRGFPFSIFFVNQYPYLKMAEMDSRSL